MNSVQRLLMLVHLLEGAWAGLDAEERLTLVSTILSSTVTPADVDGWVRSIEAGGPAGVDPDLVADVRELRAVCASARRVAIAADDAALDQAGS